ncbi:MAG: F0F1 ATP synthase subunit A [Candidatus Krumholzibacteria bacterium]|jgi:F-type H+-transporting ATPase subunit a|nr:F0F1 ATP synthase subunit A [Candidatus Krumholzibacteria bacterium]MDP6669696.1 F0F1 ATP synthase subunit A [Candidatus Krumholzibacteria bacterium]MDP6796562.1 F0F1 ATP synthase subunit A [Candidatus Krumholzibacteria bacterium]MDP7021452.1 F0F1 ATP synthase subunit A [Candidatus Krumholzibacteria bacterium]
MIFASSTLAAEETHHAAGHGSAGSNEAVAETAHAVEHAADHAGGHEAGVDAIDHILNHNSWHATHDIQWNVHDFFANTLHFGSLKIGGLDIDLAPSLHVVMLWLAGVILVLLLRSVANRQEKGVPKGRLRNFFESIVVFLRDEVVFSIMGADVGRRYLPYLLTVFFFILSINLLGLFPTMSTATGNINVTATLAIFTFLATLAGGIRANGFIGHFRGLIPPGVPLPLIPIMIPIEVMGMFTKPFALTVRLFANMIAGHIIILSFFNLIFALGKMPYLAVLPLAGAVAISAFEIFVAFLQAFIFTFLSTIFIYQAVHPDH